MDKEILKLILTEAVVVSKDAFNNVKQQYNLIEEDFETFKVGYLVGVMSTYKSIMQAEFGD